MTVHHACYLAYTPCFTLPLTAKAFQLAPTKCVIASFHITVRHMWAGHFPITHAGGERSMHAHEELTVDSSQQSLRKNCKYEGGWAKRS